MGSIIIIAPPAAGKGTQSKLLSSKYNISHVSTGDLLRNEIKNGTELGIQIEGIIKSGKLVSDEIILSSLKTKIKQLKNYILDGFPRNINQAIKYDQLLTETNQQIDYVFYIFLDKEISKKRIISRISCNNCGRVYNTEIEESKPKIENICDNCNHNLIKREDDNEESFEKRYDIYIKETQPLIDYYKEKNKLYEIDGNLDKKEIFGKICSIIGDEIDNS